MSKSDLGNRLASVRNKQGLSQEDMAVRLNISRSAYQYYERGQRDLTATILYQIYREFEVDPLWILEGDGEDGRGPRQKKITEAYRKVGIAVESRIIDLSLKISPCKKWDAIDFLFDELFNNDQQDVSKEKLNLKRVDTILRLAT